MSATGILDRGVLLSDGERDYNHVTDSEYKKLRDLAEQAYKKRQQLSHDSQAAYKSGDKQRAHELSEQAKKQVDIADNYNFQAAEYVFRENNADSDSNEIDLHGLYINEALYILKKRIVAGIQRNESNLEVIVGKGLHSKNGIAKLKPAVVELCQEAGFRSYIDKKNTGVLIIELANAQIPQSWNNVTPFSQHPSKPQNAHYNQQQQPHYQQQPQYQQQNQYNNNYNQQQNYNNNNNNNNNNDIVGLLINLVCACLKSK